MDNPIIGYKYSIVRKYSINDLLVDERDGAELTDQQLIKDIMTDRFIEDKADISNMVIEPIYRGMQDGTKILTAPETGITVGWLIKIFNEMVEKDPRMADVKVILKEGYFTIPDIDHD